MEEIVYNYKGKTVVITGAASGIGRFTAFAFAKNGANVVIGDVSEKAKETVDLITENGGTGLFLKTNVANEEDVKNLINTAVEKFGQVDFAFNNAGILPPTNPLADIETANFDKIIAVDLKGVFLAMKYQIKQMLKQGGGTIVNTSSVAGLIADPGMSSYVAAKHGVAGLTKAAALDYGKENIRINAIAPGLVRTPMTERWLNDPQFKDALLANIPMGRASEPDEIAHIVLFLCSNQASFINGAVIPVDGGQVAH